MTVPAAAASGRVTVVAPGGTGASQRDFQVDPPPAPAATTGGRYRTVSFLGESNH